MLSFLNLERVRPRSHVDYARGAASTKIMMMNSTPKVKGLDHAYNNKIRTSCKMVCFVQNNKA